MKTMNKVYILIVISVLVVSFYLWSADASYAQNKFRTQFTTTLNQAGTNATSIIDIIASIGGFLIIAGAAIAGIVVVVSGLMYMSAGSNTTRATTAKAILKNGIIGALIVFAAGLIVNTITLLASNWEGFFE